MLAAGGVLYTMLTILLDRLGMMQSDGLETARYFYNIATGLAGIGLGLTMTARHLRTARRAAAATYLQPIERRDKERTRV